MSLPIAEIQKLNPSAVLSFFILDATVCGGGIYHFSPEVNQMGSAVIWQGVSYTPMPIQIEGFEWTSEGTLPRPKIRVAALDGLIGGLVRDLEDLVGATVILKRTHARFLDGDNFPAPGVGGWGESPWGDAPWGSSGGNPYEDPTACWPDEPWIVERKAMEDPHGVIEFELCTPIDQPNAQIPKRRVTANVCGWQDATICPFSVGLACAKTLPACKTHSTTDGLGLAQFTGGLPFGAFPGTRLVR